MSIPANRAAHAVSAGASRVKSRGIWRYRVSRAATLSATVLFSAAIVPACSGGSESVASQGIGGTGMGGTASERAHAGGDSAESIGSGGVANQGAGGVTPAAGLGRGGANAAGAGAGGRSAGAGGADRAAAGVGGGGVGAAGATGGGAGGATRADGGTSPDGSTGAAGYVALPTPQPSVDCRSKGDGQTTITLVNHCSARLEARGSNWGGKTLEPGAFVCIDIGSDVEPLSALRYWGFLGADPGGEHHTLAEFTLNTDFHDFDWYDISHVDAHNLPMQIVPFGMSTCRTLSCPKSLLADCPDIGKLRDGAGNIVSCVSPDRNNAASPVATYFEQSCADAYAWSGDDAQSMVACAGEDYDVVFCP